MRKGNIHSDLKRQGHKTSPNDLVTQNGTTNLTRPLMSQENLTRGNTQDQRQS